MSALFGEELGLGGFGTVHSRHHPVPVRIVGGQLRSRCDPVDRKSTRLNSSHVSISYAVFCLKKQKTFKIKINGLKRTARYCRTEELQLQTEVDSRNRRYV